MSPRTDPSLILDHDRERGTMRYRHGPYSDSVYSSVYRDDTNGTINFRSDEGATSVRFTVPLDVMRHWRELLDAAHPEGASPNGGTGDPSQVRSE